MDRGRAIVGASVIGALVLAAGLVVETVPDGGLTTDTSGGGVCGAYPDGATDAAAWFMAEFDNDSGHDVHVRTVRVRTVAGVRLEHLSVAPHPDSFAPGLIVTDDPARPAEFGSTVPVDSGVVVPAHRKLDVVGRIVLEPGRRAGYVRGVDVTEQDRVGRLRTVSMPIAFGVGIGDGHHASEIGCDGT